MKQAIIASIRTAQADFRRLYWNLPMKPKNAAQRALFVKHGSPYSFAMSCALAVGDMISVDEAETAIQKYIKEWKGAK